MRKILLTVILIAAFAPYARAQSSVGGQGVSDANRLKNTLTLKAVMVNGDTALTLPPSGNSLQNLTLTANATITIPRGRWPGQHLVTNTCQDDAGDHTPTFAGANGVTLKGTYPTPTATAGKCDLCGWGYTAANVWQLTGCMQNE